LKGWRRCANLRIVSIALNFVFLRVKISVSNEEYTASIFRGTANPSSIGKGGDRESNPICTANLIAILSDISVYNEVYAFIKSNSLLRKSLSGGEDKQTLDEMSESSLSNTTLIKKRGTLLSRKLKEVIEGINNWTYQCQPLHKLYIRKANGKLRPVAIPSLNDIILQTGIILLIDPVCKYKLFNKTGYWYRASVYDALHSVRRMVGVTWMIEGRIKNFIDNIDINTLVNIIKDKLKPDRTIMGILHKLIKAGYMEYSNLYPSYRDSVGGILSPPLKASYHKLGILSPILLNIYLTSLDEFINKLPENSGRAPESRGRIYYVRYGDEWVIGVVGPFQLAKNIMGDIRRYLWEELKLEHHLSPLRRRGDVQHSPPKVLLRKTRAGEGELSKEIINISHLGREYAKFLGHYVGWPSHFVGRGLSRGIGVASSGVNALERLAHPGFEVSFSPSIFIPVSELKSKLVEMGFADNHAHPKYMGKFIFLSDYEIVQKYNRVLINIISFYNTADNRSGLRELIYILEYSLAHTLAAKHRSSLANIFSKYGKPIRVMRGDSKIKFAKPNSLSVKYLTKKYGHLSRRVLANTEGICIDHLLSYIFGDNR